MAQLTHPAKKQRKSLPKKSSKAEGKKLRATVKKTSLSRAALRLLVATSPTPAIFDEGSEQPPFDLQDK